MENIVTFSVTIPITLIMLTIITSHGVGDSNFDITTLGASPDGSIDSSKAFLSVWNSACLSIGSSTITVPNGQFLVKTAIEFKGNKCKSSRIVFDIKGTIVGPTNFEALGNAGTWFTFNGVTGVSISAGTFVLGIPPRWRLPTSKKKKIAI